MEDLDSSRFAPMLDEICELLHTLHKDWTMHLRQVHYDYNASVDCLAKFGAHSSSSGIQVLETPFIELETLVLRDSLLML